MGVNCGVIDNYKDYLLVGSQCKAKDSGIVIEDNLLLQFEWHKIVGIKGSWDFFGREEWEGVSS